MADRRGEQDGGLGGWLAERAGEWDLRGQDETTMQRQKYLWNFLVDYWFRMEMDGWDNLPEPPVLLVGIHSGAPFVWDAWTVGCPVVATLRPGPAPARHRARRSDGDTRDRQVLPRNGRAARRAGLDGDRARGGARRRGVARR